MTANRSAALRTQDDAKREPLIARVAHRVAYDYPGQPLRLRHWTQGSEARRAMLDRVGEAADYLAEMLVDHGVDPLIAEETVTRYLSRHALPETHALEMLHDYLRWARSIGCYDLRIDRLPRRERGDGR